MKILYYETGSEVDPFIQFWLEPGLRAKLKPQQESEGVSTRTALVRIEGWSIGDLDVRKLESVAQIVLGIDRVEDVEFVAAKDFYRW